MKAEMHLTCTQKQGHSKIWFHKVYIQKVMPIDSRIRIVKKKEEYEK
jgi:hypothetical protein